jgi:hypothetical protein
MRTVYFCPTSVQASGGIKVIYRHAELLADNGVACSVFHPESPEFRSPWFSHHVDFFKPRHSTLFHSNFGRAAKCCAADRLDPLKDFAVIPDVWAGALGKQCIDLGQKYAIFVQGGYLLMNGRWPHSIENLKSTYEHATCILSISEDTTRMIRLAYPDLDPEKIIQVLPDLGDVFFAHAASTTKRSRTLTYMNRRLPEHSDKVLFFLRPYLPADWNIVLIDNMTESQVATVLSDSAIFMSFCDQEGFALPPLEAALCGNAVVGYTGQAAKEYFQTPVFQAIENGNIHDFVTRVMQTIHAVDSGLLQSPEFLGLVQSLQNKYARAQQLKHLLKFAGRVNHAKSTQ